MSPVPASLDRVDCRDRYVYRFGDLAHADVLIKQQSDRSNSRFVKDCSTVLRTSVRAVLDRVSNIFMRQTILKIARSVVVSVAIKMSNDMAFWSRAKKVLCNYVMDVQRLLPGITRTLRATDLRVVTACVRLPKEPLSVFDRRDSTKIAHFVASFIPFNRHPGFRGVHG